MRFYMVLPAKIVIEPAKAWMSLAKIAFGYVFKGTQVFMRNWQAWLPP